MNEVQIDVVRGRVDDALSRELLAFWEREARFTGPAAQERLAEVVAVVRRDGALAGTSSVLASEVPPVDGVQFWVLRTLLPGPAAELRPALIARVFAELDEAYDESPESPAGLCVLADGEEQAARPEVIWDEPPMIYAGYLADGRQIRVAYFADEWVRLVNDGTYAAGAGRAEPYRFLAFAEQDELTGADVAEMWVDEGVLPPEEAERRLAELLMVAVDAEGRPVAVSTAYRHYNEQLRSEMWYSRQFVAAAHRRSRVSEGLTNRSAELLERRTARGDAPGAIGVIYEVENPGLIRHPPRGRWPAVGFDYIGTAENGAQVRVRYFPGAHAPSP